MKWFQHYKKIIVPCLFVVGGLLYMIYIYMDEQSVAQVSVSDEWLEEQKTETSVVEDEPLNKRMMVDMKGAVHKPGVYEATSGDRVIDLIEKAGGLTAEAEANLVNFAMYVDDEMVIYVPLLGEESELNLITPTAMGGGGSDGLININRASQTELETLPGIGPAKAAAIIEYRETNGAFQSVDDLKKVSGIGEKSFEKLQDQITAK